MVAITHSHCKATFFIPSLRGYVLHLVIARPRFPFCHCEATKWPWQSYPVIANTRRVCGKLLFFTTTRLLRRFAPRNDTKKGHCEATFFTLSLRGYVLHLVIARPRFPFCHCEATKWPWQSYPVIANTRRVRGNLLFLQQRDCFVASLLAMTHGKTAGLAMRDWKIARLAIMHWETAGLAIPY